jgi:hypothetical protein
VNIPLSGKNLILDKEGIIQIIVIVDRIILVLSLTTNFSLG